MRLKSYTLRSLPGNNSTKACLDLPLQFEGERAFVVLETLTFGKLRFSARMEINPKLLEQGSSGCDFLYRGDLVLPRPEHN